MQSIQLVAAAALAVLLAVPGPTHSGERATREEVFMKVHLAMRLLRDKGFESLSEIRDPNGPFVWKDTYVFVVDCDADRVIANPAFPERVGGDIRKHTDYAGFRYGDVLCETARQAGGGWVDYVWLRPGSDGPERKSSFVISVPGTSLQVGAGVYEGERG